MNKLRTKIYSEDLLYSYNLSSNILGVYISKFDLNIDKILGIIINTKIGHSINIEKYEIDKNKLYINLYTEFCHDTRTIESITIDFESKIHNRNLQLEKLGL